MRQLHDDVIQMSTHMLLKAVQRSWSDGSAMTERKCNPSLHTPPQNSSLIEVLASLNMQHQRPELSSVQH